ncbi:TolC family outer membrane protein [Polynucleobacter sp. AP-Titi-500A-B4]|uniref:TolC family outer membrane protein n=1 Tax=Polynucleobacter sp. AP-Titi-500A-B4 TaxID=2576923 RepID=UPI001BFD31F6|nr:TolC family outer membrane protein [Polynucleobacter sp. AP-Titi-500A-B4]QWE11715.1 TolC family outer membrane protein [Polynucleobacter sp. AP-Titi-500A-B4]
MKKHFAFSSIFLLAISSLASNAAQALNLFEAYELALRNDPVYRSASKDYEAGMENNPIGRSAVLPKLTASYNQNANRATQWGAQYTGGPNIAYNWNYPSNYSYVQVVQPIFSLDAFARWRQGIAQADLSQSKFIFNTQDLLLRVLQAYTDVLFSLDQLQFQTAERDAFYEQYKAAKSLNKNGEASVTDMLEAEAAYQVADAKLVDAKDAVENAKRKLDSMLGEPMESASKLSKLSGNFQFINLPTTRFEDWKDKALASNAELKAATSNVEIAKQEYRKNHGAHYPVVNLIGAFSTQTSNTVTSINQTFNQTYVGVQLNMPLYSGGEVNARTNQAYSNYEKAQADFEVTRDKLITELRKQYDLVVSGKQKVQALSSAQESATQLVKAMRKSVSAGDKINVDVLLAEKGLFNTRRDLAQTKYNYLIAYLRLCQLGGSLDGDDFQKVAAYFK